MSAPRSRPPVAAPAVSGPDGADVIFTGRAALAQRYARLLATDAVTRGLIGPREVPRLWERHLINCAVVTELLPAGARVVDVGSGAGLPGLVLAIRRPDLSVVLVESLQRRIDFLTEAIAALGLTSVQVVHGRAEEASTRAHIKPADWVTARAVAPLGRLVRWCLPLLLPGGQLLAIKGSTASAEVADHRSDIQHSGASEIEIVQCGVGIVAAPTTVVVVTRSEGRPGLPSRAKR